MVEARRVSDRVVTVVVYDEDVLWMICGYAPQSGRCLEEKKYFRTNLNVSGICIL